MMERHVNLTTEEEESIGDLSVQK